MLLEREQRKGYSHGGRPVGGQQSTAYQRLGAGTVVSANYLQGTVPPGAQMTPLESTFAGIARQLFLAVRKTVVVMGVSHLATPRMVSRHRDPPALDAVRAAFLTFGYGSPAPQSGTPTGQWLS